MKGVPVFTVDKTLFSKILNNARHQHSFDNLRTDFLEYARIFLDKHQIIVRENHRSGASGSESVTHLTEMTDALVAALFEFVMVDVEQPPPCVMIALGGYGRCEMNPRSDIDLMFYVEDSNSPFIHQLSERMLYLFWDLGLDVGHSVRNETECHNIAAKDLSACTALLDSRLICGNETLFNHYSREVLPSIIKANSKHFIRDKIDEHLSRQKKYGSTVYLLEPNIKEGKGGLRDLHTTMWICKVKYKVKNLRGLLIKGVISENEENQFRASLNYLWQIRTELHYLSTRKNEQMHFEQQEKIAAFLGYKDTKAALAVEQFMRDYYKAASRVEHLTSTLIARATDRLIIEHGSIGFGRRRNVDEGFYAFKGELFVSNDSLFIRNPPAIMKAFCLIQVHKIELSLQLKTMIRDNLHLINDKFRRSRKVNEVFLSILGYKKNVYSTLSQMHHLLFLNHYIPEFKKIYCQVQHDAYHIYTVDTHTLFAVQELNKLWSGEYADKKPLLTKLAEEIEKPSLLTLAVLLHDIGKGQGHNHCDKGAVMIPTIARRLGLGKEDSIRLEFLVRNHLQMAHISQRRDLNDYHLIAQFAQLMDNSENLKMLYLLTFSDIKAVGPDVWSEWKGFLLKELYEKTYTVMERGNFAREQFSEKIRKRKRNIVARLSDDFGEKEIKDCLRNFSTRYLMSYRSADIAKHMRVILNRGQRTLAMHVEHNREQCFTNVIISTLDIPALFSLITGVMANNGVNILGAQIFTQKNGVAVDILQVGLDGQIYDDDVKWKNIEEKLNWYLEGRGSVEEMMQKKERSSFDLSHPAPEVIVQVEIDSDVSQEYTVIDIATRDKVGLLYQLTNIFSKLGLYIYVSKITTKGDMAGDTFYVQDIFGAKITQLDKLQEIRQTLMDELSV
ncbi:MAG: [protein-PII] uridylyltransferase [Desulfobacteraceae bacterium 4572_35.1]|nr:MAG: [protein-PII] uridylyltransferase [Desulfobacteraceae bacterium 4572_35.1]